MKIKITIIVLITFFISNIFAQNKNTKNKSSVSSSNSSKINTNSNNNSNTSKSDSAKIQQNYNLVLFNKINNKSKENTIAPQLILKNDKYAFKSSGDSSVFSKEYDDASPFKEDLARVSLNNKWGFIDTSLNEFIPIIYDYVWSFSGSVAIVQKNRKYGLINYFGKEITKIEYDFIDIFKDGWAYYTKGVLNGYLNIEGKEFNQIEKLSDGWFKIKKGELWGFANQFGIQTVPNIYENVKPYEGQYALVNKNGKWEYIDKIGLKLPYDEIYPFEFGFAKVRNKQTFFYINKFGNEYDSIGKIFNNRIITIKNNKYGIVKHTGVELVPNIYDFINSFDDKITYFKLNNQYGFLDSNGVVIIPARYDKVNSFKCNRAIVYKNGKYGIINEKGNEIGEIIYENIGDFKENLAIVKIENKYGFLDTNAKLKLWPYYLEATDFNQGFAKVKNTDNKVVYINTAGTIVPYDEILTASDSMILVRKLNKYGFINMNGKVVIPGIYDKAKEFKKGLAYVSLNNKVEKNLYINKNGVSLNYDNAFPFEDGVAKVEKLQKFGLINESGNEIIAPIYSVIENFNGSKIAFAILIDKKGVLTKSGLFYDYIGNFKNKMAITKKNNLFGLINIDGVEFLKPTNQAAFFVDNTNFIAIQNNGSYKFYDSTGTVLPYDEVFLFSEGLAAVQKNNKFGFINVEGQEIISCDFDWVDNFRGGKAQVRKDEITFFINNVGQLVK